MHIKQQCFYQRLQRFIIFINRNRKRFLKRFKHFLHVRLRCVQDWLHQHDSSVAPHFRPYVPDALPTNWYKQFERTGTQDTMWAMWFIHYMHIEQVYAIYSNLGVYTGSKDNCLCINRREKGLHIYNKGREDLGRLMTVWKDEYAAFPKNIVRLHWDGSSMGNRLY